MNKGERVIDYSKIAELHNAKVDVMCRAGKVILKVGLSRIRRNIVRTIRTSAWRQVRNQRRRAEGVGCNRRRMVLDFCKGELGIAWVPKGDGYE